MRKTVVLIDDDRVIQEAWQEAAKDAGLLLIAYENVDKFLVDAKLYQKEIDIFIDSDLDGKHGEVEAKKVYELGFTSLTLLKSFQFDREKSIPKYITELISKTPPFLK